MTAFKLFKIEQIFNIIHFVYLFNLGFVGLFKKKKQNKLNVNYDAEKAQSTKYKYLNAIWQ